MFGPVIHLRSSIPGELSNSNDHHPTDFSADWPEDKERQEAEKEAERKANPPPPWTDEEREAFMKRGKERADWEVKNKRRWGT